MTDGSNPALRRHRPLLACVGLGMALLFAAGPGQAAPMRGAESRSGTTPVVRWYRTYANGVPVLSATITEQHIRNGYEGLDANMQVVKRVPPTFRRVKISVATSMGALCTVTTENWVWRKVRA